MGDTGHEIGGAGPKCGEAHPRRAGHGRGCLSHERGGRLMFGQHELKAGLTESLDEVDDLSAGVPEHVPDARCVKAVADSAGDGRRHANRMPP